MASIFCQSDSGLFAIISVSFSIVVFRSVKEDRFVLPVCTPKYLYHSFHLRAGISSLINLGENDSTYFLDFLFMHDNEAHFEVLNCRLAHFVNSSIFEIICWMSDFSFARMHRSSAYARYLILLPLESSYPASTSSSPNSNPWMVRLNNIGLRGHPCLTPVVCMMLLVKVFPKRILNDD